MNKKKNLKKLNSYSFSKVRGAKWTRAKEVKYSEAFPSGRKSRFWASRALLCLMPNNGSYAALVAHKLHKRAPQFGYKMLPQHVPIE